MKNSMAYIGKRALALGLAAGAMLGFAGTANAADKTHDGFYLQAATGLGYYSMSGESVPGAEESFSGMSVPLSLMLGGSPTGGLAIGGGFMIDYVPSPGYQINGEDVDLQVDFTQYVIGIGPFVDYYLDPAGGLHFQGFVGWGGVETSTEGDVGGSDPTGLVTALGVGYDLFISDEWSVGGMGRFTFAPLSFNDISLTTIEPALLVTLTYH
jgi:hypothetical protein